MDFRAVRKDVDCTMAETAQLLSSYILRDYILGIFGRSHQAIPLQGKTVRKKTKTKLSLKKYLGVLISFRGLSFRGLSFRGLSFRGLSFRGLSFRGVTFRYTQPITSQP